MKRVSFLFLFFFLFFTFQTIHAMSQTTHVYIHYYRFAKDYDGWNAWVWPNEPQALPGRSFQLTNDDTPEETNFNGKLAIVPLEGDFSNVESLGIIMRLNDWQAKDVEVDRFFTVPASSVGGIHHVYLVEGDPRIGSSINDPEGPDRLPKFSFAYFTNLNTIRFRSTEPLERTQIRLFANEKPINILEHTQNELIGQVRLESVLDFGLTYRIEATFSDGSINHFMVTYDGIYDSPEFEEAFAFSGDLGALYSVSETTWRIWAPVSSSVSLNLYSSGTPLRHGGSNETLAVHEMTRGEKGTFEITLEGDFHGVYYTFSVTNGSATHEVMDPYAFAAGINGLRGLVVDFERLNPNGWAYDQRPKMVNHTDAIIYELQVRDLTSHESWNGPEEHRARFLGLIEKGTEYAGVSTGFDHLVDLGVTHVQLLPFFDFGYVDEARVNEEGYNAFNWGYMPMNFNVLEGSFSADPFDGRVRIQEFKQVVMGFHEADIRLIMDVVYNHTGLTADSNFNLIVPGYYFRMNEDGSFSNGSGTGNETASERAMMRKFMLDSLYFWATEYNISGFRFDLMALHDIQTMQEVARMLHSIDPNILIFGEPWMGGNSPLPLEQRADKRNLWQIDGVGAFNDDFRDAVKGSVFAHQDGGFLQGNHSPSFRNRVVYGIVGGVQHPGGDGWNFANYTTWHHEPAKTINYVTAHDNNTLHDKLFITLDVDDRLDRLIPMHKQAHAMVLLAQGIPFIHAGDEFLRSKPDDGLTQRQYTRFGFVHNSYESTDTVNQIRWDLKASDEGQKVFNYVQGLIHLRKEQSAFRLPEAELIREALTFVYPNEVGIIAYELNHPADSQEWDRILVIHNTRDQSARLRLPSNGGWVLVVDEEIVDTTSLRNFPGNSNLRVPPNTTYVLYQDVTLPDQSSLPWIISGIAVVFLSVAAVLLLLKKRPI